MKYLRGSTSTSFHNGCYYFVFDSFFIKSSKISFKGTLFEFFFEKQHVLIGAFRPLLD